MRQTAGVNEGSVYGKSESLKASQIKESVPVKLDKAEDTGERVERVERSENVAGG